MQPSCKLMLHGIPRKLLVFTQSLAPHSRDHTNNHAFFPDCMYRTSDLHLNGYLHELLLGSEEGPLGGQASRILAAVRVAQHHLLPVLVHRPAAQSHMMAHTHLAHSCWLSSAHCKAPMRGEEGSQSCN